MRKIALISLAAIAAIYIGGLIYDWFYIIRWLDIPMHIAGGAWVALAFFIVAQHGNILPGNRFAALLFTLGMVAIVGIAWEFYELFMDVTVFQKYALHATPGPIHFDTLKDLFNDMLGGLFVAIYFLRTKS